MKYTLVFALSAALIATMAQAQLGPSAEPANPDTDRDGKVTFAEFTASQAARQSRMFGRMDTNKDGKITQGEMDAMAKRAEAAGRGPPGGGEGGRGGGMMRLDTNKDGAVTKAEMSAMTKRRFDMADTNKDGWLSKGELLMIRQRARGPVPE